MSFFNNLWRPVLHAGEKLGLKSPTLQQNWLSADDVEEPAAPGGLGSHQDRRAHPVAGAHCPLELALQPLAGAAAAGFLLHRWAGGAAQAAPNLRRAQYRCSVVIPARNEAGNIEDAVRRTPEMGPGTEIIFIEGHSTDDTWGEIQRVAAKYPQRDDQGAEAAKPGQGRRGARSLRRRHRRPAVHPRRGPDHAAGGVAEVLRGGALRHRRIRQRRAAGLSDGRAGHAVPQHGGEQAVWPDASVGCSGQKIKDTLCGTKVLFRADYEAIARNRAYFGDFDPFGDFDLLFGAAKLNLRMVDLPIRYRARTYGQTNIHRWRHGWLLLRMVIFAARRLKFIP